MDYNLLIDGWEDDEYRAFTEKFKTKKTTDDCYTPALVYEAVADWVACEYGADKDRFVRPFYPGGDYERFDYPEGCAVVDNPPFSILAEIIRFYSRRGISFFLFAPALTLFSSAAAAASSTSIPCGVTVTYANGAKVLTSFVTNMDDKRIRVRTAPSLYKAVEDADDANRKQETRTLPKYEYPDYIITAAMVQRWCKYGVDYRLTVADSRRINALEAQRKRGLSIFGKGFLVGSSAAAEKAAAERAAAERAAAERAAAERAAAERAAAVKWKLSEAELEMVRLIDRGIELNKRNETNAERLES